MGCLALLASGVRASHPGRPEGTFDNATTPGNDKATMPAIENISRAVNVTPGDLLATIDDPPKANRKAKKTNS